MPAEKGRDHLTDQEHRADAIFVSIEMSRSKWVVGAHTPLSDKISLYTIAWGDSAGLRALIDRLATSPKRSLVSGHACFAAMRRDTKGSGCSVC